MKKENEAQVRILTGVFDGQQIGYSSETIFYIQVGNGPRGAYRTYSTAKGNLTQAVALYTGLYVGRGFKKRLLMGGAKRPLARYQS